MKRGRRPLAPDVVESIREMRSAGKSMAEVATALGCHKTTVQKYAIECGLGGRRGYQGNQYAADHGLKRFLANMKTNGHAERFEYVSGYEGCESVVVLKCLVCGELLEKGAAFARRQKALRCSGCLDRKRVAEGRERKRKQLTSLVDQAIRDVRRLLYLLRECPVCGREFVATTGQQKLCGPDCQRKQQNRTGERCKRARRHKAKRDRGVTLRAVLAARGDVCYLCGERVDPDDYVVNDRGYFIVGPNYPSVEHLVPLSKGGGDTWDNVMVAHHKCNSAKRDRLIIGKNGQMLLLW